VRATATALLPMPIIPELGSARSTVFLLCAGVDSLLVVALCAKPELRRSCRASTPRCSPWVPSRWAPPKRTSTAVSGDLLARYSSPTPLLGMICRPIIKRMSQVDIVAPTDPGERESPASRRLARTI
jgi:hypothetical protein